MLNRIARLALAAPRRVIALAALLTVATAAFGLPVINSLSAGGMRDPGAESSKAAMLLSGKFGRGDMDMLITVTAYDGARAPHATAVGAELVERLKSSPNVRRVLSLWTVPPAAAQQYISKDGKSGLIIAGISGGENDAPKNAKRLSALLVHDRDGVTVRDGGEATAFWQANDQTKKDLVFVESLAMPLSFLVLVWVFGGLVAAALPATVGGFAVLGAMASLHAISLFTDVSTFALNVAVAMSMALAIDYTLLIVTRFRDELREGHDRDTALIRTMVTTGRTVLFSAMTVALSMATLVVFPQYFLKSFAYAVVAVVAFAATAAIVVTPAAIALLGDRLDSLDFRRPLRRHLNRQPLQSVPVEQWFWYRWTKAVMRHAIPIGTVITVLLLALGAPFLGSRWGFPDDRLLPSSASARQVGNQLRVEFPGNGVPDITVVLPDINGLTSSDLDRYTAELSQVPDVTAVSSPNGTFVNGRLIAPPSGPAEIKDGSAFVSVSSSAPLFSDASAVQLRRLHAVPSPSGKPVQLAGIAESSRDNVQAITARLVPVLVLIVGITLIVMFLVSGSVILPFKAVAMNVLSLTGAFGALVWVFQEGHLGALGTAVTGTLAINVPVLLFSIAFGVSMDYEVILITRIREHWLESQPRPDANDESVALGVAHTGKVITAAAVIMAISFAALMGTEVSFMRMFGFGLTVAVLADATLVRMLLVPAFMHMMGRLNWWAPKSLARLHARISAERVPREQQQ